MGNSTAYLIIGMALFSLLCSSPSQAEEEYVFVNKWPDEILGFRYPKALAVDSLGNVYVADASNDRVQKFTSDGTYLTQWGTLGPGNGQFRFPYGVAIDSSGNVYVTDVANHRVQKFTSDGTYLTKWGTYGSGNGQFRSPEGIATDSSGNVYVADRLNHRIQKFTSDGAYLTQWGTLGSGDGQFDSPVGMATDSSGNVYVADKYNHRVQKFTSDGAYLTQWGTTGSGNGQFQYPEGIATDNSGNLYVTDNVNHRVQKFTSDGTYLTQWGTYGSGNGQFCHPEGIATDSSGNVYVADSGNDRVQKFTSDGTYLTQWGTEGSDDGQFRHPEGIATDSSGSVYVADSGNDRVQKFTSDGTYLTQWGTIGSGNGQFRNPRGIAFDSSGNVYVADSGNDRIQKFTSDGAYLTQWRTIGSGNGQWPSGIATDSSGNVYVADSGNDRIQKFTSDGAYLTQWGTLGSGDGQFDGPVGIAIDSSGNVYVADTSNHRVQVFRLKEPDARIQDLRVSDYSLSLAQVPPSNPLSVVLKWTAPGDDENEGTARVYDIRYSPDPITDNASFNSATKVPDEDIPTPAEAGTTQTCAISNLSTGVEYHFALKAADEVGNWSEISNVASVPFIKLYPEEGTAGINVVVEGEGFYDADGDPYEVVYVDMCGKIVAEPIPNETGGFIDVFTVDCTSPGYKIVEAIGDPGEGETIQRINYAQAIFNVLESLEVDILSPDGGAYHKYRDSIHFEAIAYNGTPPYVYTWESNIDGPFGVGREVDDYRYLSEGHHLITVEVKDHEGETAQDKILLTVTRMEDKLELVDCGVSGGWFRDKYIYISLRNPSIHNGIALVQAPEFENNVEQRLNLSEATYEISSTEEEGFFAIYSQASDVLEFYQTIDKLVEASGAIALGGWQAGVLILGMHLYWEVMEEYVLELKQGIIINPKDALGGIALYADRMKEAIHDTEPDLLNEKFYPLGRGDELYLVYPLKEGEDCTVDELRFSVPYQYVEIGDVLGTQVQVTLRGGIGIDQMRLSKLLDNQWNAVFQSINLGEYTKYYITMNSVREYGLIGEYQGKPDPLIEKIIKNNTESGVLRNCQCKPWWKPFFVHARCPVDLAVTDSFGHTISRERSEIDGATYMEFQDDSGDPHDLITFIRPVYGPYMIEVIPEPDALPTDMYTLEVYYDGALTKLAEDIPVQDIPHEPYDFFFQDFNPVFSMGAGWHLISLPVQPQDTSVGSVLNSVWEDYESILTYEPNPGWRWHSRLAPFGNLQDIESGAGYWIDMQEPGTLAIPEWEQPETAIPLKTGWNLVGYSLQNLKGIEECMSSIEGEYNSVWEYDPIEGWRSYIPDAPDISTLWSMRPWYGYWVDARTDCMWNVDNPSP